MFYFYNQDKNNLEEATATLQTGSSSPHRRPRHSSAAGGPGAQAQRRPVSAGSARRALGNAAVSERRRRARRSRTHRGSPAPSHRGRPRPGLALLAFQQARHSPGVSWRLRRCLRPVWGKSDMTSPPAHSRKSAMTSPLSHTGSQTLRHC